MLLRNEANWFSLRNAEEIYLSLSVWSATSPCVRGETVLGLKVYSIDLSFICVDQWGQCNHGKTKFLPFSWLFTDKWEALIMARDWIIGVDHFRLNWLRVSRLKVPALRDKTTTYVCVACQENTQICFTALHGEKHTWHSHGDPSRVCLYPFFFFFFFLVLSNHTGICWVHFFPPAVEKQRADGGSRFKWLEDVDRNTNWIKRN